MPQPQKVFFYEGFHGFAHCHIKGKAYPLVNGYQVTVVSRTMRDMFIEVMKYLFAQELALTHKFTDIDFFARALAPVTGSAADFLGLYLTIVYLDHPKDFFQDQWHCVLQQRLGATFAVA